VAEGTERWLPSSPFGDAREHKQVSPGRPGPGHNTGGEDWRFSRFVEDADALRREALCDRLFLLTNDESLSVPERC
jgi:hypothetical protein